MLLRAADKRGLSIIIGYVLLIVISIVMSVVVYQWLKTYVPDDAIACPDGTSMFIKEINYDCTAQTITITVKNNGRFSLDGYFIHASNRSEEKLSTIDLSPKVITASPEDRAETISGSEIRFANQVNSLSPENESNTNIKTFDVSGYGTIYKIEIIPVRIEEINNQRRVVGCTNAKSSESISCN
jgi:membrane-bound inhibitor of C-type lysozyme